MTFRVFAMVILTFGVIASQGAASEPTSAEWANRAADAIRAGEFEEGIALLRRALKSAPNLDGLERANAPHVLTAADIEHGREQVRRLARDRPALLTHRHEPGFRPLIQWAARRFAGEGSGLRVDWNNEPFEFESLGIRSICHRPRHANAVIQISRTYSVGPMAGRELPSDVLWQSLVFELFNVSHMAEFQDVDLAALKGRLTRCEYVERNFFIECRTERQTQEFYCEHYLPALRTARGFTTFPTHWRIDKHTSWLPPEEAITYYVPEATYPWKVYCIGFDEIQRFADAWRVSDDDARVNTGKRFGKAK